MVANSHNLIVTVRPQNDMYNLKRTGSSSTMTTAKSPLLTKITTNKLNNSGNNTSNSTNQSGSEHNSGHIGEGLIGSDDEDVDLYRLHDTHIDSSHLQKTPSVLKL